MKPAESRKAERRKKTKIRTKPEISSFVHPPVFYPPASEKKSAITPPLHQATKQRTRQRTSGIEMPPGAAEKLAAIEATGAQDTISEAEAAHLAGGEIQENVDTQETPEKLPEVVKKDITTKTDVELEWHQVKHLPGYLRSSIRAFGRQVFGTFTKTPIEEIQVLANLGGRGPNTKREIDAAAGWLQKNGVNDTHAVMDFERSIPDYKAEMVVYRAGGRTFLLVRDFAGNYIYTWPSSDEKAISGDGQKAIATAKKRLEHKER